MMDVNHNLELVRIIDLCEQHEVELAVEDGQLSVLFDGELPEQLLSMLKAHKLALIDFLLSNEQIQHQQLSFLDLEPIEPLARDQAFYPLSYAQQRLWFVDCLEPGLANFNITTAITIKGAFSLDYCQQAMTQIIERHEPLRTVYSEQNGVGVQQILPTFDFTITDKSELVIGEQLTRELLIEKLVKAELNRGFDLSQDLMLRVSVAKLAEQDFVLVLTVHHIASDGWSMGVLIKEFVAIYTALVNQQPAHLPELEIQYVDYANWQAKRLSAKQSGSLLTEQLDYWQQQLQGAPWVHQLPLDFPRTTLPSTGAGVVKSLITPEVTKGLDSLANAQQMTRFMMLHAVFAQVLAAHSFSDDIIIGTPVANRRHLSLEPLIGFFVNTIALRTRHDFTNLSDYLAHVKGVNLEGQNHQDVLLEQVIDVLQVPQSLEHMRLVQIVLSMNTAEQGTLEVPGLSITPLSRQDQAGAKFDLEVIAKTVSYDDGQQGIELSWIFDRSIFTPESIENLSGHFLVLAQSFARSFTQSSSDLLADLTMLTAQEQQNLLERANSALDFNAANTSIIEQFNTNVAAYGDAIAVVEGNTSLTYHQLAQKVSQVAMNLERQGLKPQQHLGLYLHAGIDMVVSLLAGLSCGCAFVPLDPKQPSARLEHMIVDAKVSLIVTTASLQSTLGDTQVQQVLFDVLELTTGDIGQYSRYQAQPHDSAYVIYTSGSTGLPKGVVVNNQNWLAYLQSMQGLYQNDASARLLQFSSTSFDIFIEELSLSLLSGGTLVFNPSLEPLASHEFWQFIADNCINTVSLPTAYWHQLCADDRLNQHIKDTGLKTLILGGEAMSLSLLKRWQLAKTDIKLFNTYGPTETTIIASGYQIDADFDVENRNLIPIGSALKNTGLYVLDKHQQLAPFGAIGQLYIAGPQVAEGYFGQNEQTQSKFVEIKLGQLTERMYQSGDLVRFDKDGQLLFIGREDKQVKIAGFRVELAEIQQVLEQLPQLEQACVVSRHHQGANRLMAYVVLANASEQNTESILANTIAAIKKQLSESLADYMVPTHYGIIDKIPLTANGKLDESKLPPIDKLLVSDDACGQGGAFIAPKGQNQLIIARLWAQVLAIPVDKIGSQSKFFSLGGDSLLVVKLLAKVSQVFAHDIPLRSFYANPTVSWLANELKGLQPVNRNESREIVKIAKAEAGVSVKASSQQQRIWLLNALNPDDGGAYHIYHAFDLNGELNKQWLQQAFSIILSRHDSLSCALVMDNKQLWQKPAANGMYDEDHGYFVFHDLSQLPANEQDKQASLLLKQAASDDFDLDKGPLLRATLIKLASSQHQLMITVHHIAADGWSVSLLAKELSIIYAALSSDHQLEKISQQLPVLPLQYRDYSAWQDNQLANQQTQTDLDYWQHQLADLPLCHDLALDYPRPARQTFIGKVYRQPLNSDLIERLNLFAVKQDVTLFMLLQSAFAALLSRYSHSDDICLGTPVANRPVADLENLIGCFINTIVLRNRFSDDMDFEQCLAQSAATILDGFAHQALAFESLVEALQPERNTSFSPLFQIMFVLHNNATSELLLPGIEVKPKSLEHTSAKFDLTLNIYKFEQSLVIDWEYNSALFDESSIERLATQYQYWLGKLISEPNTPLVEVPLLLGNDADISEHSVAIQKPVFELFEQQVANNPQACALIDEGQQHSYQSLNHQANQMARWLITQGIEKGTNVAVMMEHQTNIMVSLLAIMKAGACYVPIDIEAPRGRVMDILTQADVKLMLVDSMRFNSLSQDPSQDSSQDPSQELSNSLLDVQVHDANGIDLTAFDSANLSIKVDWQQVVYVLFTSGSTGKPKGVEVVHQGFSNLLTSMAKRPGFSSNDKLLAVTPLTFDISGLELFLPLISGGVLVLDGKKNTTDGKAIGALLEQHQITMMQATPTMWRLLTESGWQGKSDLVALSGGEAITSDLALQLQSRVKALWNMYGPTETTIWSFCGQLKDEQITIGEAIDNTAFVILDKGLNPVPTGVSGQLYIGGKGLAKGYLNQPQLTEQTFISWQGQRLYATGDLVRVNGKGQLLFMGRIDHQIKLRGFRIEPGEIETCLNQHPQISDSLVMVYQQGSRQDLLAYYVPKENQGADISIAELRSHLAAALPSYMIPTLFVRLAQFALTSSGKKDRKQLPAPNLEQVKQQALDRVRQSSAYVAPNNELEQFIVDQLKASLSHAVVGIEDNFFELGATSLDLVQLAQLLSEKIGRNISAVELFDKTNAQSLAAFLQQSEPNVDAKPFRQSQISDAKNRLQARANRKTTRARVKTR